MAVEGDEPGLAELPGRAQFASAEGGRRSSEPRKMRLDRGEAVGERQRPHEAGALDAVAGLGDDTSRILELVGVEAVSAGGEGLQGRHRRRLLWFALRSRTRVRPSRVRRNGEASPGAVRAMRFSRWSGRRQRVTLWA